MFFAIWFTFVFVIAFIIVIIQKMYRACNKPSESSCKGAGEDYRCNINPKWDSGTKYRNSSRTDSVKFHSEGDSYKGYGEDL